jgi:hypothetical protein
VHEVSILPLFPIRFCNDGLCVCCYLLYGLGAYAELALIAIINKYSKRHIYLQSEVLTPVIFILKDDRWARFAPVTTIRV